MKLQIEVNKTRRAATEAEVKKVKEKDKLQQIQADKIAAEKDLHLTSAAAVAKRMIRFVERLDFEKT